MNANLPKLSKHDIPCSSATVNNVCQTSEIFSFQSLTIDEVYKELISLNVKKGPGPDNFNVRVLYMVVDLIAPHLTYLFNSCIKEGIYPDNFKVSKCLAIYKGNKLDPDDPVSYRPI